MPKRLRFWDFFTLRPYGQRLLTPAAKVWLGSAWVVILLMASIEGFVWGAVGASLVPAASAWLVVPVAAFMFLLLFSVIWILDASLVMSERPSFGRGGALAGGDGGWGAVLRWWLGILVRVGVVAISLYVTAPFIEKLVRADDIAGYHQAQVARAIEQRAAARQAEIETRLAPLEQGLAARAAALEAGVERTSAALAAERARRERLEAELAPEVAVLTNDLAEARARVGDEVLGRDGRPEGFGPEARKWQGRAEELAAQLAARQGELAGRLAPTQDAITALEQELRASNQALGALRDEQRALFERVSQEVDAEQPPFEPPTLTFAARSLALNALRQRPAERGVPHFETVEGFAQAALGILFFALLALKLFEPTAVKAYFSESVQFAYQRYLDGGLRHLPGFGGHDDPRRRLTAVEFSRLWGRYQRDPEGWLDEHKALFAVEARARQLAADHAYEQELTSRRREGIDHELALEQRRRETELSARERELEVRLTQWGIRLADETRLRRERDALALGREQRAAVTEAAAAAQAARAARLAELQAARDAAREQRVALVEQLTNADQARADQAERLAVTDSMISDLATTVAARRTELAQLAELAALATAITAPGAAPGASGLGGWLRSQADPRQREQRRLRRGLEKQLAAAQQRLDALRGERAQQAAAEQQAADAASNARARRDAAERRIAALERGIDAVLLADWRHQRLLLPELGSEPGSEPATEVGTEPGAGLGSAPVSVMGSEPGAGLRSELGAGLGLEPEPVPEPAADLKAAPVADPPGNGFVNQPTRI